jgi:hypothetical protein
MDDENWNSQRFFIHELSVFLFIPLGRRLVRRPNAFFPFGKISPNFDLKNMISTYTKDFSREKKPKFARFAKKIKIKIAKVL